VPDGAVTVFSAHGVPQSVVLEAKSRELAVIDATCPLVSKVHSQAKHYVAQGRVLILIGHPGHPEVEGTMGQAGAPVHLVSSRQQVDMLDLSPDTPVAYVTQTTLSMDDTSAIIEALKERFRDIQGPHTSDICYATQNRQSAVRELCKIAEVILVVGSKNSSNSNRLREIGVEEGIPSYLIADADALDPAWLAEKTNIGLTAGASAPEALVLDVIDALRRIDADLEVSKMDGLEEHVEFRLPVELRT